MGSLPELSSHLLHSSGGGGQWAVPGTPFTFWFICLLRPFRAGPPGAELEESRPIRGFRLQRGA